MSARRWSYLRWQIARYLMSHLRAKSEAARAAEGWRS